MVKDSSDSLLSIINDILDFSKIEAGKLDIESIDFCLRESIGDTLKALALKAHDKGLELAYHVEGVGLILRNIFWKVSFNEIIPELFPTIT